MVMNCVPVPTSTLVAVAEVCANCGKEGNDAVKLKDCAACLLVKYCSVDCQKAHRKLHKKTCKERAVELKDERLYGQGHKWPEQDFCPICLLPLPLPTQEHSNLYACCSKMVCDGCCHEAWKIGLDNACPFCRSPTPKTGMEVLEMVLKRVAAKDPVAMRRLGDFYFCGEFGLAKDESRAIELISEAAKLGSTAALYKVGVAYYAGLGGVSQDKAKGIRCLESAAMQGDADSRHMLGYIEEDNRNVDRAVRHYMISAKMGHKDSLDTIRKMFANRLATRAQYAETLKGYQDAMEEMKSPERDEAVASGFADNLRRSQRDMKSN